MTLPGRGLFPQKIRDRRGELPPLTLDPGKIVAFDGDRELGGRDLLFGQCRLGGSSGVGDRGHRAVRLKELIS